MLIPITIGYEKENKVIKDLADKDFVHLLVCLKKNQFNRISKKNLLLENDNFMTCSYDFRNNNKSNKTYIENTLRKIEQEINGRYELFIEANCKNIFEYNKNKRKKLKHIVILCFGYPKENSLFDKSLIQVLQLGRAAGIHLICFINNIFDIPEITILNFMNKISTNNNQNENIFINYVNFKLKEDELALECMWENEIKVYKYRKEETR